MNLYCTDYASAEALLHTRGKPVTRRKVNNNTYLERRDPDTIAVKLHNTDIVTYHRDSRATLNSGGWLTVTTKARMNDYLPMRARVTSDKGTWYVHLDGYDGRRVRYTDGITVCWSAYSGTTVDPDTMLDRGEVDANDRHNASIRRLLNTWLKGMPREATVIRGYNGHPVVVCVLCQVQNYVPVEGTDRERPITIGDNMGDTQHLIDHMVNGDYPYSLLHTAVEARGYNTDMVIGWNKVMTDVLKRCLRQYMLDRLLKGGTASAMGRTPVLTSIGA